LRGDVGVEHGRFYGAKHPAVFRQLCGRIRPYGGTRHGRKRRCLSDDEPIMIVAVALVPGSAFGAPGYMRLSFATDLSTLKDALTRIAKRFN